MGLSSRLGPPFASACIGVRLPARPLSLYTELLMTKSESTRFHEVADRIWEIMKEARSEGHRELEKTLTGICDILHAKGSGLRIDPKSVDKCIGGK